MFNLNDFIGKIFIVSEAESPLETKLESCLPAVYLSEETEKSFDKSYLDFIVAMYITAEKSGLSKDTHYWFYEEIAYSLHKCYPNFSSQEYEIILNKIIKEKE
jgi:hypothetical protein